MDAAGKTPGGTDPRPPQRSHASTLLRLHAVSRRKRFTLHVVRFTRPPDGASSMVLQAIGSQGKGVDKLFSGKESREHAGKMYRKPLVQPP